MASFSSVVDTGSADMGGPGANDQVLLHGVAIGWTRAEVPGDRDARISANFEVRSMSSMSARRAVNTCKPRCRHPPRAAQAQGGGVAEWHGLDSVRCCFQRTSSQWRTHSERREHQVPGQ
jgi:hypothetical protein